MRTNLFIYNNTFVSITIAVELPNIFIIVIMETDAAKERVNRGGIVVGCDNEM